MIDWQRILTFMGQMLDVRDSGNFGVRFYPLRWTNKNIFCSTSLPLTSTRWFNKHIQAFPHSKKWRHLISATSRIEKNSWEHRESNPGLLGKKRNSYHCAMQPPFKNICLHQWFYRKRDILLGVGWEWYLKSIWQRKSKWCSNLGSIEQLK